MWGAVIAYRADVGISHGVCGKTLAGGPPGSQASLNLSPALFIEAIFLQPGSCRGAAEQDKPHSDRLQRQWSRWGVRSVKHRVPAALSVHSIMTKYSFSTGTAGHRDQAKDPPICPGSCQKGRPSGSIQVMESCEGMNSFMLLRRQNVSHVALSFQHSNLHFQFYFLLQGLRNSHLEGHSYGSCIILNVRGEHFHSLEQIFRFGLCGDGSSMIPVECVIEEMSWEISKH